MDVVIVDDEPLARDRLKRMLADEPDFRVVAEVSSGDRVMAAVMEHDPDIVLLDIHMPGESGLLAAQQLVDLEDPPAVIFCTAYEQHALEAFGVNAVDYLLKPVRKEKLLAAMQQACNLNKAQRQTLNQGSEGRPHISARTRRGVELIPIEQIHFFAADHKYVTVYHREGETLIDDTLKELEQSLGERFVRVHRNALVALNRIEAMEKGANGQFVLRLTGTQQRPVVSRRHVAALRQLLTGAAAP
ncbi:response regulator transcription factor [Pseudomaricurvus alkylphenolicus]|jgi:two-component system response regulator AlgR|uniref:LytR/AlgR family response regulator transcription factor n=1 Tax=Pseudomaricurvus alkylphenolicus TaxID=1306991 RepID=UPI0014240168|nr:LytTR family DNA-binding domain-containing protein [Pseudomaricurvus alkylphenolicus]NIB39405.1 response regulator transcription factor [Pseudomaricurvus alkylphenolicus]